MRFLCPCKEDLLFVLESKSKATWSYSLVIEKCRSNHLNNNVLVSEKQGFPNSFAFQYPWKLKKNRWLLFEQDCWYGWILVVSLNVAFPFLHPEEVNDMLDFQNSKYDSLSCSWVLIADRPDQLLEITVISGTCCTIITYFIMCVAAPIVKEYGWVTGRKAACW